MEMAIEQFAKTLHDTYIRIGPHRPVPFDELSDSEKHLVLAVYHEVFKSMVPAAAGSSEGGAPTHLLLSASETDIRIDFGQQLSWMAFPKADAINLAIAILQKCGVPVNVTFNPEVPPGAPPTLDGSTPV